MTESISITSLETQQGPIEIEYQYVGDLDPSRPLVVFLHEGLGSRAMWKDFPHACCDAIGVSGLVYSRPGYGKSTPRDSAEKWPVDFMHRQAFDVLPKLLKRLEISAEQRPLFLLGHSDGGSIALLYASQPHTQIKGVIALAPHLFVEDVSIDSIRQARETYLSTDLKSKLARYHDDPDSAFWGWNDIWLSDAFRRWNIEAEVSNVTVPILAIQGENDEYGSLEQIRRIKAHCPQTRLLALPDCGHSPHRDQPDALLQNCRDFVQGLIGSA